VQARSRSNEKGGPRKMKRDNRTRKLSDSFYYGRKISKIENNVPKMLPKYTDRYRILEILTCSSIIVGARKSK
jgi:hypothetical protein